jgi:peptide deformylase
MLTASRGDVEALRETGERLLAAMAETRAQGLAAAHIGEIAPIVAIRRDADVLLLFNPEVMAVADETAAGREGSVSMPGIEVEVSRPTWAEIAYLDREGKQRTERFDGWTARIALHEIDQVNGIFFLERVSRLKRDFALKKWRKLAG